jgi:hypothetical protein
MKTNRILTIIALLGSGSAEPSLAQDKSNELKQRVLAQAQSVSPDDYAFTRTIRSDQTQGGKTEKRVTVEKFDPAKSGDGRWTLVSVDGAPPSAEALTKFRDGAAKRRVPGYSRIAGWFGTPSTASTDSRGRTVFHFAALPKGTAIVLDTDVSQNATAAATVSEANGVPFVEQVHVTVKPMRLKLIAKIEHYESTSRYRMGPEGKPLVTESTSDMSGSGMGQTGQVHNITTYADYHARGARP